MENKGSNIFLISNMWPDADSPGYGSFVKNVAEGLEKYGFRISETALIKGKPKGRWGKIRSYLKFYKEICVGFWGRYDFIYIHFPNQAVPLLEILCRFRHPRIVINYHGEDLLYNPSGYTGRLGRLTESFCRRRVHSIVVPSEYYKKIVLERGIISEDNIIVSPSGGISEEIFYPAPDGRDKIPDKFSTDRPIKIGYIGRLEPEKGILVYLDSLKALKKEGIPFESIIIGYGSLTNEVERFIDQDALRDKIQFIHGVPQAELGRYYRDLDLFIFPSLNRSESLGLTGIEAMACGVPVIGSDIGGIATYIKDGSNGFLSPPGIPECIMWNIKRYISLPKKEKLELVSNAITTGSKYYSHAVIDYLVGQISKSRIFKNE